MSKTMTLRLDEEQARALETIAQVDGVSISDAARAAINDRIEARRKDADFRARLRRLLEENREALKRLA
jgi:predicted transcriptional regulator